MKKNFFLAAIVIITLTSCRKELATSSEDKEVGQIQSKEVAGPEAAHVEIINLDGRRVYNSCTNEYITLYGNLRVVAEFVDNGRKAKFTLHTNSMGVYAIGESGRKYTVSGTEIYQISWSSTGDVTSEKDVWRIRFITAGSESDFVFGQTFFLTVDAEGNVTFKRDFVNETYCQ